MSADETPVPKLYPVRALLDQPEDWSDEGNLTPQAVASLREIARWICEHLARSHPELGRRGPVCPATIPSVDRNLMWVLPLRVADRDLAELEAEVMALKRAWLDAEPTGGRDRSLKAIVAVLQDVPRDRQRAVTLELQRRLKPSFLDDGLMLGEFFPESEAPGLRNRDFRPLRATQPLLVIREMIPLDIVFLSAQDDHSSRYQDKFGDQLPDQVLEQIGSVQSRISEPYALEVLAWALRVRRTRGEDPLTDALTGLPTAAGLEAGLSGLWSMCPHAAPSTSLITVQVGNVGACVRQRGHPVFELGLFRLAHLVRETAGEDWSAARTGYGEVTVWAAGVERDHVVDAVARIRAALEECGDCLLPHNDWVPRFGVGARMPGRGRRGARSGLDASAASRARDLYERARPPHTGELQTDAPVVRPRKRAHLA